MDRRPLRGVLALVVQDHPNRAGTDLRGIRRNSLRHRSILSRVGASDKPGAVQGARQPLTGEARLAAYLDAIVGGLGHARRAAAAQAYCTGLLLPGERKSIEPMAARLDPTHVQAKHQALHHVVAQADWDDAAVLAAVRAQALPAIARHGPVLYWIVDDTSFPKQGMHSVGVARQYCGQLGKQDNCQVAVSLSVANDHASLPIAYRLFLPAAW